MLATLEACVDATLLRPILLIESASVRAIFLPSSTDGNEVEMEVPRLVENLAGRWNGYSQARNRPV